MPPIGPVPGCLGTARFRRDAPRAPVRGIRLLYPAGSNSTSCCKPGPRSQSVNSAQSCRGPALRGIRGAETATRYPHLVLDELCATRGILKTRDGYRQNPTAPLLPQHFFS